MKEAWYDPLNWLLQIEFTLEVILYQNCIVKTTTASQLVCLSAVTWLFNSYLQGKSFNINEALLQFSAYSVLTLRTFDLLEV